MHTKSFSEDNTLSKVFDISVNNQDDYHDCDMISRMRINHAISTGLSVVMIDNKTNQILSLCIYFDQSDLPSVNESNMHMRYKSKRVKLREELVNRMEANDEWIQNIRKTMKKNDFGQVMYAAYSCKNKSILSVQNEKSNIAGQNGVMINYWQNHEFSID